MKILLILLMTATTALGQLDYSPKSSNKESAAKMHFAIKLFRGVSTPQERFLLQAIRDRRSISETEAAQLFSTDELRDVFFGMGRTDVKHFKQVFEKGSIAQKKAIWRTLTKDEQVDIRRINFAWGVGYLNLNEIQIDYLLRFSKKLPTVKGIELDVFQAEAALLFPKDIGRLLFGSIGPYEPCTASIIIGDPVPVGNCPCSIGSSFNMSCDSECSSPTGCTVTGDGCGFAWLYACDGSCRVSSES
jgi:hypothetical protein